MIFLVAVWQRSYQPQSLSQFPEEKLYCASASDSDRVMCWCLRAGWTKDNICVFQTRSPTNYRKQSHFPGLEEGKRIQNTKSKQNCKPTCQHLHCLATSRTPQILKRFNLGVRFNLSPGVKLEISWKWKFNVRKQCDEVTNVFFYVECFLQEHFIGIPSILKDFET